MVRKTVSLQEELIHSIEEEGLLSRYKSFSDLVSEALRHEIERNRSRQYEEEIEAMRNDPLVQEDIAEIEEAFRFSDADFTV